MALIGSILPPKFMADEVERAIKEIRMECAKETQCGCDGCRRLRGEVFEPRPPDVAWKCWSAIASERRLTMTNGFGHNALICHATKIAEVQREQVALHAKIPGMQQARVLSYERVDGRTPAEPLTLALVDSVVQKMKVHHNQGAIIPEFPGTMPDAVYFDEAHQVDGLALALSPATILWQARVSLKDFAPEIPVTPEMVATGTHTLIGFNLDPSFEPVSWAHIVRDVYLSMHDVAPNSETARAFRDQELIAALTAERDEALVKIEALGVDRNQQSRIRNDQTAEIKALRTELMAARDTIAKFTAANIPEPLSETEHNPFRHVERDRRRMGPEGI